jgi:hypothetical protein
VKYFCTELMCESRVDGERTVVQGIVSYERCESCGTIKVKQLQKSELLDALAEMASFSMPERYMKPVLKAGIGGGDHYREGDGACPILSEAFLYSMLGKEDARVLLSMFNRVVVAAGFDQIQVRVRAKALKELTGDD